MKQAYATAQRFHRASLGLIDTCETILAGYHQRGFTIAMRQLYYRLVIEGRVKNTPRSYENLVSLMTNARMAGRIDWEHIVDPSHCILPHETEETQLDILHKISDRLIGNLWKGQPNRVIVTVEKEAIATTMESFCREWGVTLLITRGYASSVSLRELVNSYIIGACPDITVLHFGDHDPSGLDISRDLQERLELFSCGKAQINFCRVGLTMEQVEELHLPPNPTKVTDSRFSSYNRQHGGESWELEALDPSYLHGLLTAEIFKLIDFSTWNENRKQLERVRAHLRQLASGYQIGEGECL